MLAVALSIMAVAVICFLFLLNANKSNRHDDMPYQKSGSLFTIAERSFLGVLIKSVGADLNVFGKVRVADVITTVKGINKSDRQRAFNKISAKHFDFVLCDKNNLKVLCVVELNDSSHETPERKKRDEFLRDVCEAANMPLIQVDAKRAYSIKRIRSIFADFLPENGESKKTTEVTDLLGVDKKQIKMCPECLSNMVIKKARNGKKKGESFWGCNGFPKCRHIEELDL